jgi:general stress protein 26
MSSHSDSDVEALRKLIKDESVAMLTTVAPDGSLRSRPMATQAMGEDQVLWFFTRDDSGKVDEVNHDEHVGVAYVNSAQRNYVSLSGRARLVRDRAKIKELWQPMLKAWFPGGVDDPQVALLRVEVQSAEYWDAPSSRMVSLFKMATSAVTGSPPNMGKHGEINLRGGPSG